jgi:hypothetical protein
MSEIVLQQYDNNITQNYNPFYHHTDYVPGFIMHTLLSRDMLPSLEDIVVFVLIQQLYIYFDTRNDDEVIQVILERNGSSSNRRKELQGYLLDDTINALDEVWTFENITNDKTKFTRRMVSDDGDDKDDDDDDVCHDKYYVKYDDEYDDDDNYDADVYDDDDR